ncbi:transmembrane protein 65 isoform X2 [Harmonia axyridis]|uniref:transmembrane protein 65 isoform X2 n=1 Tax=Harmonia axyridis TaxID=115357 RepID=UPI001E2771AC|nr:transmembrane protein 65 isoform X2 [Harmonia axyridis]
MANKVLNKCLYFSNLVGSRQFQNINKTIFPICSVNEKYSVHNRNISGGLVCYGSGARAETTSTIQGLSKLQAQELVLRLNQEERQMLLSALQEYQSKLVKEEYEAEAVPRPTTRNLVDIAIANSIPFIGFGFLDNFFMLIAGDYIDMYLGSYLCITTMAAAALGNTLSDILGIGSAFYVERIANRIGFSPPKLSPIQMDMSCSRNFANLGRVLGVTLGCLLGMLPLLFKRSKKEDEEE